MADNSTQAGADTIRDKDRSGVKTQIVGLDLNINGAETLMAGSMPVTITDPDTITTGTISTTDLVVAAPAGAGAMVTGTPTAGSYVVATITGDDAAANVVITGLTSGTLYFEASNDSTNGIDGNWIAVNYRQTGVVNTVLGYSATTNGVYRGNVSAVKYLRVRSSGALTGTPAINVRTSGASGAVFLNASIPAGTNSIGTVLTSLVSGATAGTATGNINATPLRVTGTGSATTTVLLAAPGAGISIYVTDISCGNSGSTLTTIGFLPLAGTNVYDFPCAANGGGATVNLRTPWKLAANTGLNYVVSASTTSWFFTVNYFLAA